MHLISNSEKRIVKRKSKFFPSLFICLLIAVFVFCSCYAILTYLKFSKNNSNSINYIYHEWENYNYKAVYDACNLILDKKPFNNTALTFKGYSAFYLAVSQQDFSVARDYLDIAIFNIRVAMQNAKKSLLPQLNYMLGKTYFYKNTLSSYYYYADLAVFYLTQAQKLKYKSDDIFEYLGLSYAALGQTEESILSFTEALLVRESDSLLLSIAEQYHKSNQDISAKQYLHRVITNSTNESLVLKAKLLLAKIYLEENDIVSAKKEFQTILEKDINSADAYYGLGVIYEKEGDIAKARAEWRKALRVQVNHPDTLQKISDYK